MELFCSESVNELAGAMLKVQAEISPAIKDGDILSPKPGMPP
jgi:hypothetical protein